MGKISWLKDLISAIEKEENWDSDNSEKITFHVTFSIGVGYYTSEYENRHEAFVQEVDQKLYQSKYTGKNTIT